MGRAEGWAGAEDSPACPWGGDFRTEAGVAEHLEVESRAAGTAGAKAPRPVGDEGWIAAGRARAGGF